jgi:hypothetical protein
MTMDTLTKTLPSTKVKHFATALRLQPIQMERSVGIQSPSVSTLAKPVWEHAIPIVIPYKDSDHLNEANIAARIPKISEIRY